MEQPHTIVGEKLKFNIILNMTRSQSGRRTELVGCFRMGSCANVETKEHSCQACCLILILGADIPANCSG